MTAPEKIWAWQWIMPYPSLHERKRSWHEDSFPDGQVATEYVRKDLFDAALEREKNLHRTFEVLRATQAAEIVRLRGRLERISAEGSYTAKVMADEVLGGNANV